MDATPEFDRIADYLAYHARNHSDRVAVVFGDKRWAYSQLKEDVECCAKALYMRGIRKGDRVAVMCTSRPEYWISFLAAAQIGAIWVGLNLKYRVGEMEHVVRDSEPDLLIAKLVFEGRHYDDEVSALRRVAPSIQLAVWVDAEDETDCTWESFLASGAACDDEGFDDACRAVQADDPVLIVYTSGTTGVPKGAVLSQRGIGEGAAMQSRHLAVNIPSVVVNFPINHVACVADSCATTYVRGGKIVFQERFEPGETLAALEKERCTLMGGVPTMLQMMLSHPGFPDTDLSCVELIAWGGAAMPREGVEQLSAITPRLMSLYGMTETAANVVFSNERASIDQLTQSVGRPDSAVGCRIQSAEGEVCAAGEAGELQFNANFMMLCYWRNPEASRAAFTADGWLKTGDQARWRSDGTLELVGRLSEMYKSGGYNVYPREIELVLESMPGVAMAAVIAAPDPLFQEVGHAFVLPEPGAQLVIDRLRETCREQLANYKVPKEFTVTANLPLLPVGKIDKKALAARAFQTTTTA